MSAAKRPGISREHVELRHRVEKKSQASVEPFPFPYFFILGSSAALM
jgi:hypothetical protein